MTKTYKIYLWLGTRMKNFNNLNYNNKLRLKIEIIVFTLAKI